MTKDAIEDGSGVMMSDRQLADRLLSAEQVEAFRKNGVVHLPKIVEVEIVAEMVEAVERMIEAPSRFGRNITAPGSPGMFFQDRHLFPNDAISFR